MTTGDIQRRLCLEEIRKRNIVCENVKYLFNDWEQDVLSLNASGYVVEFEVKVSRSDFLADRKKHRFNAYDTGFMSWHHPNRFYYATPPGLVQVAELPWFAGLIYVADTVEIIRKAPLMNKKKHDRAKILTKFCRVLQERKYLGKCSLTIKNEKARKVRTTMEGDNDE